MINIFIVDDHSFLSEGVASAFEKQDCGINVVGHTTSCFEALVKLESLDVDVVLLDIIMPEMDGIECCKRIKHLYTDIKVIAFTGELDPSILLKIWLEKVDGILLKSCGMDEMVRAIHSVVNNQKFIGDNVPSFLDCCEPETNPIPKLTKREIDVLKLLSLGLTRQEAADKMNRSMYSVEFHCKNMLRKFNTNRINIIIAEARKARIIK